MNVVPRSTENTNGNGNVSLRRDSPPNRPRPSLSDGRSNPEVVGSIPTEVKIFFLYLVWLPDSFTRANAQWVIHGFISTLIYTSELILCFTICILSATRHNIHMYPYFLFAAIHHLIVPDLLCPTVDLIRRSWVRFPPRSKYFFFTSCGYLIPLLGLTPSGLFMVSLAL